MEKCELCSNVNDARLFQVFFESSRGLREAPGSEIGVLGFLVSAQIDFSLKGSAAQVARERLVTRVLPAVSDQI